MTLVVSYGQRSARSDLGFDPHKLTAMANFPTFFLVELYQKVLGNCSEILRLRPSTSRSDLVWGDISVTINESCQRDHLIFSMENEF
jgi:hypothetical protein